MKPLHPGVLHVHHSLVTVREGSLFSLLQTAVESFIPFSLTLVMYTLISEVANRRNFEESYHNPVSTPSA